MNKTIKEHPDSYNGWTNYATWRVNLEILGDMDWYETEHVDADYLQELVENIVFDNYAQPKNGLMEDYARAFLNDLTRFFSVEAPQGLVCFIITVPSFFLKVFKIDRAE